MIISFRKEISFFFEFTAAVVWEGRRSTSGEGFLKKRYDVAKKVDGYRSALILVAMCHVVTPSHNSEILAPLAPSLHPPYHPI